MISLREPIEEYFRERRISVEVLLYVNPGVVSVYIGRLDGSEVVSKVIVLPPGLDPTILEREYVALKALSHESVLRMYDCFWAHQQDQYYLVFVTERCKTDLGKGITQRALSQKYWTEEEMWTMLTTLVNVLAYMQEQGFVHRDLKPENIFCTSSGVKLGDFGSSRFTPAYSMNATLAGSPLYLSPILKRTFLQKLDSAIHHIYKSDVYSLGVTFVYLSTLSAPFFMMEPSTTEVMIHQYINSLGYSDTFKQVLIWMLQEDEVKRCDFLELRDYLNAGCCDREPVLAPVEEIAPLPANVSVDDLSAQVICLQCQRMLVRVHLDTNVVIALDCRPLDHIFCSRRCLQEYIKAHPGNEVCPECQDPLPTEVLEYARMGYREWIAAGAYKLKSILWRKQKAP